MNRKAKPLLPQYFIGIDTKDRIGAFLLYTLKVYNIANFIVNRCLAYITSKTMSRFGSLCQFGKEIQDLNVLKLWG